MLDTDTTFITDIAELWLLLAEMKRKDKVSFTIHNEL